jgi:hypothetical protein
MPVVPLPETPRACHRHPLGGCSQGETAIVVDPAPRPAPTVSAPERETAPREPDQYADALRWKAGRARARRGA